MTDGSSQGLFVIVAVVIFGIFVIISYLLFRDKLQTGLASIFQDSIAQANKNLLYNKNFLKEFKDDNFYTIQDSTKNANYEYLVENNKNIFRVDNKDVSETGYRQVGLYKIVKDLKFNKGDSLEISVYAKGTGKLYFGLEGFEKIGSVKIITLTNDYQKYTINFKADEGYEEKEALYKSIVFYTYNETNMYIHSPEYKLVTK